MELKLLFSDYFNISSDVVESYGALDICVNSDLPLFIAPFLLFASKKDKANPQIFQFPEIKQNWLGFWKYGNNGKGLGKKFAKNIITAFNGFYADWQEEPLATLNDVVG